MVTLDEQTKEQKMMTRKDFQAFATSIAIRQNEQDRKSMAMLILPVLKQSNPRFNVAKFLKACNVTDVVV